MCYRIVWGVMRMNGNQDWFVLILVIAAMLIWLWKWFHRWLHQAQDVPRAPSQEKLPPPAKPIAAFLQGFGYQMYGGKVRLPLQFNVDEQQPLYSRLFVDGFAEDEDAYRYIVLQARERKPIEWTGSGIRDRLLVYALLYDDMNGILYADIANGTLKKITFAFDEE